MNRNDLPDEDRAFLDSLARKVWQARREGPLIGCLYTFCMVGMLYVALFHLGPTHAVSALCYGGMIVVLVEAYRKFFRAPWPMHFSASYRSKPRQPSRLDSNETLSGSVEMNERVKCLLNCLRLRLVAPVAACTLLTGCWYTYAGFIPIETTEMWVPPDKIGLLVDNRSSREEVIDALGQPQVLRDDNRAIGYRRCTEPRGGTRYLGLPPTVSDPHGDCQIIGVWFDEEGRVVRAKSTEFIDDGVSACTTDEMIRKPSSTCWW
jgi:hypothetical protein